MKLAAVFQGHIYCKANNLCSAHYRLCFARSVPSSSSNSSLVRAKNSLTHLNERGKINFVNVNPKRVTRRSAVAEATVCLSDEVFSLVRDNRLMKGDFESTVKLAGVMGAKQTANLIPLCHNIVIDHVYVEVGYTKENSAVKITVSTVSEGKTGVEMESLTGASLAALTVYDMCKSYGHEIEISEIKLISKSSSAIKLMFKNLFDKPLFLQ